MTTLADASTMPAWSPYGWALLALAVMAAVLLSGRRNRPQQPAPVQRRPYVVCQTTGCGYPARVIVQSFTGLTHVCHGCADEGIAHGWFTAA